MFLSVAIRAGIPLVLVTAVAAIIVAVGSVAAAVVDAIV